MGAVAESGKVAKKKVKPAAKGEATPRRYGTLIRVSDQFAEALKDVVGFEKTSVAEFADAHLLPLVQKRYRDAVLRKARQIEGGGN